ncbi:jg7663 [Pararge aegeria aegeria]|uniref:Jg7663 protein n=1 Tax=Pararge aegeria aegeria TaxID=348720 RepID=A0A8S4QRC0_9NEOP|nr:jg7663 [Pararge aegeria aegeria]
MSRTQPMSIEAVHADASLTQVGERQMSNAEADCASLSLVPRFHLHKSSLDWNASERGNAAYVMFFVRAAGSIEL